MAEPDETDRAGSPTDRVRDGEGSDGTGDKYRRSGRTDRGCSRCYTEYPPWIIHYRPIYDNLELVVNPRYVGPNPWDWVWMIWVHGPVVEDGQKYLIDSFVPIAGQLSGHVLKLMDRVIAGNEDAAVEVADLAVRIAERVPTL